MEFQQHQPPAEEEEEEEVEFMEKKNKTSKKKKNTKKREEEEEETEAEAEADQEEECELNELDEKGIKYENDITKVLHAQKVANKRKAKRPQKMIQTKIQKKGDQYVIQSGWQNESCKTPELVEEYEKKSVVKVRKPPTPLTEAEKKRKHYQTSCMSYYDYQIANHTTPQIYLKL